MGFFDLKAVCAVCAKEVGLNRFQIANKEWVCPECLKKSGISAMELSRNITAQELKKAVDKYEQSQKDLTEFISTKKIGTYMEFDDERQLWLAHMGLFGGRGNTTVYQYSDIVGFELLEDGESIIKGGLGRAVAGGLLFGGLGAIVGGTTGKRKTKAVCNSLKIKITVYDIRKPTVYVNFITTNTRKDGMIYKQSYSSAQECMSSLQLICDRVSNENKYINRQSEPSISNADEILKYKKLRDDGIISKEEFEFKKKQLLGL